MSADREEHTPGPWTPAPSDSGRIFSDALNGEGRLVAVVYERGAVAEGYQNIHRVQTCDICGGKAPVAPGTSMLCYSCAEQEGVDLDRPNARLIAAAPERLEAAEDALAAIEHVNQRMGISEDDVDLPSKLRNAIAKARGENYEETP